MGKTVRKSSVVYLTEEREVTLKEALDRAGIDRKAEDNLYFLHWHDTIGTSWPGVMRHTTSFCKEVNAKLLVIDTFSQFANLKGDSENDAGAVLELFRPVQQAAATGLAVVAVRHSRKSGGGPGSSGRGSSAFAGAVDIVLSVTRLGKKAKPTLRKIESLSRFNETPSVLYMDRVNGEYELRDRAAAMIEDAEQSILNAAGTEEKGAPTEVALIKAANVKRTTGQEAIKALVKNGKLYRIGKGVRNYPYRYIRKSNNGKKTKQRNGSTSFFNKEKDEEAVAAN